jgi:protein-S-isoprenylcysteine O-methyltransferase Ste14
MRPLVLHQGTARGLFTGVSATWVVAEVATQLRRRWRGEGRADRRGRRDGWAQGSEGPDLTFVAVFAGVGGGVTLAQAAARAHVAPLPGGAWWPVIAGLTVMVAGAGFRLWAILTLGRFFRFVVMIQPGHRVVDRGPYRWIRHPSYTGLLVGVTGIGLALDDWVALAATSVLSLAGLLVRMRAEERALLAALGPEYADYMSRTRRLIPGVW